MAVKPKNVEEDSWAYTLPHEVAFLIQELAEDEAEKLKLSKLSTSDYLERTVRQLAEEKLSPQRRARARERAEKRTAERRRKAEAKAAAQEKAAKAS